MMRKFSWMLLVLVLVGCGDEVTKEEDKPKVVVKTWEKDGAEMVLIPDVYLNKEDKITPLGEVVPGERYKAGDAFLMDVYEVTRGQFRKFLQ